MHNLQFLHHIKSFQNMTDKEFLHLQVRLIDAYMECYPNSSPENWIQNHAEYFRITFKSCVQLRTNYK